MKDLFRGELVRFTFEEPDTRAKAEARWQRDTEYFRLADSDPCQLSSEKKIKEWFDKQAENGPQAKRYSFSVRTLSEDKYIGFLGLWVDLIHSEAWVGLAIGEREFWSKGYGSDMMKLCIQYVFTGGLERLSLGVHSHNPRASGPVKMRLRLEDVPARMPRTGIPYLWMGICEGMIADANGVKMKEVLQEGSLWPSTREMSKAFPRWNRTRNISAC
jgi:RimJ/RimL family protein N-acetyltransferase